MHEVVFARRVIYYVWVSESCRFISRYVMSRELQPLTGLRDVNWKTSLVCGHLFKASALESVAEDLVHCFLRNERLEGRGCV